MRRPLLTLLAIVGLAGALTGFRFVVLGVPASVAAKVHVYKSDPKVIVTWVDTAATIARSEVRRWTPPDTTTKVLGSTQGGSVQLFEDDLVSFGKTYRYQVRDSISGQAWSAWSDSASATVRR